MNFIEPLIQKYCIESSSDEDDLLKNLSRETKHKILMPRMISGHYMGSFLKMISYLKKPDKILEIGTYTGYSTICLSAGLTKKGEIHSIDINEEILDFTKQFIDKSKNKNKIYLHTGDATKIIPKIKQTFDLIFIDADKNNYPNYYELSLTLLRPNGIIIIDNMLWHGDVADESKKDAQTNTIRDLNKKIQTDERIEFSLLPLSDGLSFIRKK